MRYLAILFILIICSCSSKQDYEKEEEEEEVTTYYEPTIDDIQDSISSLPKDTLQRMRAIVKRLSEDSIMYITRNIGYGGHPTLQYEYADHLSKIGTSWQLKRIALKHPSAVVRGIVFNALVRKDAHAAVEVAIRGINDTTYVETMSCDCGDYEHLNELRVTTILHNKNYYNVSDRDHDRLDSAILFSKWIKLERLYSIPFENLTPKPEYYQRLKSLYNKKNFTAPIIALVKYDNEESRKMLEELLESIEREDLTIQDYNNLPIRLSYALCAVSHSPTSNLYKESVHRIANLFLEKKHSFYNNLYSAIMEYEEPWAFSLIESSVKEYQDEWNLYDSYRNNPKPYFKSLYDKYCERYK